MKKLAFIGTGKMGEALVKGVLKSGLLTAKDIIVSDKNHQRLSYVSKQYKVDAASSNQLVVREAEYILLSVKPQDIDRVLTEISSLADEHLLISIAAGVRIDHIQKFLGYNQPVARIMPNAPALVGSSISAICYSSKVSQSQAQFTKDLFTSVGEVVEIEEDLMNQVTAVSGSGPAYFYYFVEALARAGEEVGLPFDVAKKLSIATMSGAAKMLSETGLEINELIGAVKSKGGTTEAALNIFEENNISDIIQDAVKAASQRAFELGG
jgi:pyrroline-5-carboxylate reductase